jgi:hypothetical protein
MHVLRGTVVSGKVVVEGAPLEEGAHVMVLVPEKERPFSRPRRGENYSFEEAELLRDLGGEG